MAANVRMPVVMISSLTEHASPVDGTAGPRWLRSGRLPRRQASVKFSSSFRHRDDGGRDRRQGAGAAAEPGFAPPRCNRRRSGRPWSRRRRRPRRSRSSRSARRQGDCGLARSARPSAGRRLPGIIAVIHMPEHFTAPPAPSGSNSECKVRVREAKPGDSLRRQELRRRLVLQLQLRVERRSRHLDGEPAAQLDLLLDAKHPAPFAVEGAFPGPLRHLEVAAGDTEESPPRRSAANTCRSGRPPCGCGPPGRSPRKPSARPS